MLQHARDVTRHEPTQWTWANSVTTWVTGVPMCALCAAPEEYCPGALGSNGSCEAKRGARKQFASTLPCGSASFMCRQPLVYMCVLLRLSKCRGPVELRIYYPAAT